MRLIIASALGLLIVCMIFFPPARATQWVGNDDGEFDVGVAPSNSYVFLQESLSTGMSWSSSPPNNVISMQYNPDRGYSWQYQGWEEWFQTTTFSDSNGCISFSIQVYSMWTGGLDYRVDDPATGCAPVSGVLQTSAVWYIQEDMNSVSRISDVYFGLTAGGSRSHTFYPPQNWQWLRSNLCWCGTNGGATTFANAGGTSYMGSNLNMWAVAPPIQIATAENSNMPYGQFQGSGTTLMTQSFGWSPPTPPPCSGGGCGH